MNKKIYDKVHLINHIISEMESLYHQVSLKMGISDSVSIVLYTIHVTEGICLLSDIYKKSGISKQTVNSAIRRLEDEGILYLEEHTGRSKKIILTEIGNKYINKTVAKLYEAEVQAFESWTKEEINTYVNLMEKYKDCFRKKINAL
ncbi:MAG: winged helix-turn-helix transcriptional regulator [Leptotrichiaceae bacterium]|nr:winged helix-turn-helix transcriptional regulator [Leptotrichiaceae bacterium]